MAREQQSSPAETPKKKKKKIPKETKPSVCVLPALIRLAFSLLGGSLLAGGERGAPAHLRSAHTAPVGG